MRTRNQSFTIVIQGGGGTTSFPDAVIRFVGQVIECKVIDVLLTAYITTWLLSFIVVNARPA
jgi:hypothetical protein